MNNTTPDLPTTESLSPTPPSSGRVVFTYPELAIAEIADRAGCDAELVTFAELAGMDE